MQDLVAIKALIVKLVDRFPGSRMTGDNVVAYAETLLPYGVKAVAAAIDEFMSGKVDRDHAFFPQAPEIAKRAEVWSRIYAPRPDPVPLHNGLLEMDFGHGMVNMRGLTLEQQDKVIAGKGFVAHRNAALLPRTELLALLDRKQVEHQPEAPKPTIRRMAE